VDAAHAAVVVLAIARVGDAALGVVAVVAPILAAVVAVVAPVVAAVVAVVAPIVAPIVAVIAPIVAPIVAVIAPIVATRLDHGALLQRLAALLQRHARLDGLATVGALLLALVLTVFLAVFLARLAVVLVLGSRRGRGPAGEQRGEGGGSKDAVAELAVHGDSGCVRGRERSRGVHYT
jgi:hypothetical protein